MELWYRSLTALLALVVAGAVLTIGWWGWRPPRAPPSEAQPADVHARMPRSNVPPQYADAMALRTMELLKTREALQAAEARYNEEVRRRAQMVVQLEQLRNELQSLKAERDEALEFALRLLEELQAHDTPNVPLTDAEDQDRRARPPQQGNSSLQNELEVELLAEIERLRQRLAESQSALEALLERVADVESAVQEQHHRIAQAAARVVRHADTSSVVAALVAELSSPYAEVRRWAAQTLQTFGPDAHEAIEPLQTLLADPNPQVRDAAQAALRAIHD